MLAIIVRHLAAIHFDLLVEQAAGQESFHSLVVGGKCLL